MPRVVSPSVFFAVAIGAILLGACSRDYAPQIPPVSPELGTQTSAILPAVRPAIPIFITPPSVDGLSERSVAKLGLLTALLERGLADLPDVIPHVAGRPPSPGLAGWPEEGAIPWEGALTVDWGGDELAVTLELCSSATRCRERTAYGLASEPWTITPTLLAAASRWIPRVASPTMRAAWREPIATDDYALVMLGRSAAAWYGWTPRPLLAERRWDHRFDPVARATFLDSTVEIGWWLAGRHAYAEGDFATASESFRHAHDKRQSLCGQADHAAATSRLSPAQGGLLWAGLGSEALRDPRFSLAIAVSGLQGESLDARAARLDALPDRFRSHPAALAERAEIARQLEDPALVGVLHRWAKAEPSGPEPLMRLLEHHLARGAWDDARSYLDEFAHRAGADAADPYRLALLAADGDWAGASGAAQRMNLPRLADDIALRGAVVGGEPPWQLAARWDTPAVLLRARAALEAGRPESAQRLLAGVLRRAPWDPDALALSVRALAAAGRAADAEAAWRRLEWVEPAAISRAELLPLEAFRERAAAVQ